MANERAFLRVRALVLFIIIDIGTFHCRLVLGMGRRRFFKVLGKAESGRRICTVQVTPHKHICVSLEKVPEHVEFSLKRFI